ncbi:MAG: hypothetical protein H6822_08305 [Planctomycetaceae bacterium]|nr:hypothetical protein [Planctomycetales bacterium]MCB9922170.1 hypothetical protein [Planctomycetaceae bacterium]
MIRDLEIDRLFAEARRELYEAPSVVANVGARIRQLAANASETVTAAPRRVGTKARWRQHAVKLQAAVVAAVLLLVFMSVVFDRGQANVAFAQVVERVAETRSMKAELSTSEFRGRLIAADSRRRLEGEGFAVVCDSQANREIFLDTRNRTAHRNTGRYMHLVPDWYALFRNLDAVKTERIEDFGDAGGARCPGFRGETEFKVGEQSAKVGVDVWVHPNTQLPVRAKLRFSEDPRDHVLVDDIHFDVPVLDEMFDLAVPDGYQLVGLARNELKPPLSEDEAARLTIIPGVGVGDIRFGMSRDEIAAILGEPEFVQHGTYLCYPSKGLQFIIAVGKLQTIIANPGDAPSLVQRDFPGKTDSGIGIGSTVAQLTAAYPNLQQKKYKGIPVVDMVDEKLGLFFGTVDGKVGQIRATLSK